ncbi:Cys-tRNA(Pro) deacylase [Peptoclostridium litorale DSM 5388]|uniref:YbaK/aminoacyl-tRNA synthetase-associated domain-containing protein n=1 Tax=Peptoclostridium litorale DSM 5388 TaxID=1121324 RepID=A0A069RIA3_PEPLI|nr:YbaK/EbsC family protein [Peptoclostridium litorale]KDR96731.1 hypothetical protein CLIT_2c03370 [Peptoclostridium litorale DSM 5388]SIN67346.1 Cys-tRNA(Pro) deacylase [Peptoclostridium litorale DSM 5388]
MAVEDVRKFFEENGYDYEIIEKEASTATVELAAQAIGVEPELIAKTMAFRLKEKDVLVVSKGDAKIDNRKFKDTFNTKAKMMKYEEVLEATGHPVGGVCPFGLKTSMEIYLDVSLKQFEYVYPAAGSTNSAVKITPDELKTVTKADWVDVCKA